MPMTPLAKHIARPLYLGVYYLLHSTLRVNPFFSWKRNGKKIKRGHIRLEQETNPELDGNIIRELKQQHFNCSSYSVNISAYKDFIAEGHYPDDYYGSQNGREWEFIQKTLEHFVSLQFLRLDAESVFIDIGACNSPFYEIVRKKYGTAFSYRQDLIFKPGINGNEIGCSAGKLPFPDESVDAITLHCSLEHFEGTEDISFFKEAQRVLKKGGKCVVLPFYLSSEYTIHLDPVMNVLRSYKPDLSGDEKAVLRYCDSKQPFSRHYDVVTFKSRILSQVPLLNTEIIHVTDRKKVDKDCYLRFIALFTKL